MHTYANAYKNKPTYTQIHTYTHTPKHILTDIIVKIINNNECATVQQAPSKTGVITLTVPLVG